MAVVGLLALLMASALFADVLLSGGPRAWPAQARRLRQLTGEGGAAPPGGGSEEAAAAGALDRAQSGAAPPLSPDPACPRFVLQRRTRDFGAGHLFTGIVTAARHAKKHGAALIIEDNYFSAAGRGGHPGLRRLLGLNRFLSSSELKGLGLNLTTRAIKSRNDLAAALAPGACGVVAETDASLEEFCGGWCAEREPGAFEEMRPLFQLPRAPGGAAGAQLARGRYFGAGGGGGSSSNGGGGSGAVRIVAWHLRASDITLHASEEFYGKLLGDIEAAARQASVNLRQYFFSGDVGVPPSVGGPPPRAFEFLPRLASGATFVAGAASAPHIYHFLTADVLVGSGSSFSHMAGFVAPPRVIYAEVPPKECKSLGDDAWKTLHVPGSVAVQMDGALGAAARELLARRLAQQSPRPLGPPAPGGCTCGRGQQIADV